MPAAPPAPHRVLPGALRRGLSRADAALPLVVKVGTPVMAVSIGMALYLEGSVGSGACSTAACQEVSAQVSLVATDGTALLLVVLWLVFVAFVGRRARRLADVARRVAEGDLTARVGGHRPAAAPAGGPARDELLVVGAQFDRMLDTLVREQQRLVALTDELEHTASHDALTGLGNRSLLLDRLRAATAPGGGPVALVVVDLDDFSTVNDALGHEVGDLVLMTTAARLSRCVRGGELPARLVGDEFAVLVEGVTDEADALALAHRLLAAVNEAVEVEGAAIVLRASAGVVLHRPGVPADGTGGTGGTAGADGTGAAAPRPEDLLRDADLALQAAKAAPVEEAVPGRSAVFTTPMRERVVARQRLVGELREALAAGQLVVHLQPYARFDDPGAVCGFEALVRWHHPERGLVPPGDFVPLAEETGLIRPIGLWVLEQACAAAAAWRAAHPDRPVTMSVNLAPQQLLDHDLPARVADVLARTGLPASALVLELTETAMALDLARAAARLGALREVGVRVAIDDFGTGSSSLAYLHQLPVDVVKVDQAFVARLESDPAALAMVRAVVDIASSLGLSTVAEGVETPGQFALLAELGCDLAQGYLLSRPVRVAAAGDLLAGRAALGSVLPAAPATAGATAPAPA